MSFLPGKRELRQLGSSAVQWLRSQPMDAATIAAGALLGVALYLADDGSQAAGEDSSATAENVRQSGSAVSVYPGIRHAQPN